MEVLGNYWLRRILARIATITVYEGQDTRTGMPVMVLRGAQGVPVQAEGFLPLLEETPEAWVLEWPIGAVPLSQYLGVADLERLGHWVREMARLLSVLEAKGVRYAPLPELCLVKGKRVWMAGVGATALSGEPGPALASLARALAGERWQEWSLREAVEALEVGRQGLEVFQLSPASPPEPEPQVSQAQEEPSWAPEARESGDEGELPPQEGRKRLAVEPVFPPEPGEESPPPGPERAPSHPRVIRIEEREEPSFSVVEPPRGPGLRRGLLGLLLGGALLAALGLWALWPKGAPPEGYSMEFRTEPPTERAEVILLEVPEGSRMVPGQVLLTAPGRVEFDRKGVYRLRIRVPGRDPVDYLLEVPGPPLTIRVR